MKAWNGARGFTVVEVMVAVALGTLVLLVVFRAFTAAVSAQEQTRVQIAGHLHARTTAQWIADLVESAAAVRAAGPTALEVVGTFSPGGPVECVGLAAQRPGAMRRTVLTEQRRSPCPEPATSVGGVMTVVSDPTVTTTVAFTYRDRLGRPAVESKDVRLVEVVVGVDVDGDGDVESSVRQLAALRGDPR